MTHSTDHSRTAQHPATTLRRLVVRLWACAMLAVATHGVNAQAVPRPALDSTQVLRSSSKSPGTAALISVVLPGGGHWYAKENNRGWIVAIVYFTGVAITYGGRTDTVGKIGGVAAVGAWTFGVVDGALAARRYNKRSGSAPSEVESLR